VVDDFYTRFRDEALEINPAPGARFAERERKRTELSVAFHYGVNLREVHPPNFFREHSEDLPASDYHHLGRAKSASLQLSLLHRPNLVIHENDTWIMDAVVARQDDVEPARERSTYRVKRTPAHDDRLANRELSELLQV